LAQTLAKRRMPPLWAIIWLVLGGLYFLVPLYATAQFSFETGSHGLGTSSYLSVLQSQDFIHDFVFSLELAVGTVLLSSALMVPTVYWINLHIPQVRRVVEFISILPLVVPPVALAVGVAHFFSFVPTLLTNPIILVLAYVIITLPFSYRSLDAGMRAINFKVLTEAAQSLGASWWRIMLFVILPNIAASVLASSFLIVTIVMGEYTFASLLLFNTFPVYIEYVGQTSAHGAAALALISFALTWLAILGIAWIGSRIGIKQPSTTIGAR
jgi:putative spermidine/putrescine transport system permease protein